MWLNWTVNVSGAYGPVNNKNSYFSGRKINRLRDRNKRTYMDYKGKMIGGIGWSLKISGVKRYIYKTFIWCSCLEKLIQNCVKIIPKRIYIRFRKRVVVLNRPYSTITQLIWKLQYPTEAWESQIVIIFNFYFALLIDIFDNIITYSPYYITRTSTNGSAVYWSRDTRDNDTELLLTEVLVTL